MDFGNYSSTLALLGLVTAVFTAWYSIQKVFREYRKFRKNQEDKFMEKATQYSDSIKQKLEAKIAILELDIHNLKDNVSKDLVTMKDSHALELKNLSDRIENLRDDLKNQHSQLLSVLTKLVS